MIAKQIAMRSAARSSFAGLARYIGSAHGKHERVGAVSATNFAHDVTVDGGEHSAAEADIQGAVLEAEVTQAMNTTSRIDDLPPVAWTPMKRS